MPQHKSRLTKLRKTSQGYFFNEFGGGKNDRLNKTTVSPSIFTSGVNFTNILRAPFTHPDPEIAKKAVKLSVFLALLGSVDVVAARRTLMKLTPDLFFNVDFYVYLLKEYI